MPPAQKQRAFESQSVVPVLPAFEGALAALNVGIRALAEAKGALAEFKDQCLSAGRVPEQGNFRAGCGDATPPPLLKREEATRAQL
jgi:hypothetical protein